ncbi:MAG: beta-lactamase family protein, partial [Acidobacteria bacterium]|nr:beta-lactamase family protein [Acidobacteriota bacterium]
MPRLATLCLLPALVLAADLPAEKTRQIQQAVATEMAKHSIPGVSVAMASSSGLAWTAGFGMADLENFVPVTPSTVIRLGSISKPITAVAVMQLVEQGRIELDAPIQRYVPSFPEKPWPVTVRQLLGHLGGVRHYSGLPEVDSTRHYTELAAAFHVFRDDPLLAEPGTKYSYTTYGFNL